MKLLWTLCLLFAVISHNLQAQPVFDLFDLRFQNYNDNPSTRLYTANLLLPLEVNEQSTLLFGLSYDQLVLRNTQDGDRDTKLTSTSFSFGGIKELEDQWSLMGLVIPKINADFKNLTNKDFQLGGVLLATKKRNENLSFKFGLYYNREYFGNFFMPLIGLDWKVNQPLNLYGVLPGNMNLEYRLSQNWYTGITYKSITTSYRTGESNQYVREGHKFWGHNQIKLFVNYYPVKRLMLFGELGHTGFREFTFYHDNHHQIRENDQLGRIKDDWFFNVGVAVRVRLEDENK